MKYNLSILFLLILSFQAIAQQRIPSKIKKKQKEYLEEVKDPNDTIITLPPIESIPDTSKGGIFGIFTNNNGNWGYEYLETDKWENFIRENATRHVVAFVFDTGIDKEHPNLKDIIVTGQDFTGKGSFDDGHGHGTHVSGTIAGVADGDNQVGIGKALREKGLISLVAVKVLADNGSGSFTGIQNGIQWANSLAEKYIAEGKFVIYNFSLGSPSNSTGIDRQLKEAQELGVLISYAANGNTGRESVNYPGASNYTEGIAAIDANGKRASFSTIASYTRFAFPGVSIYSCLPVEKSSTGYGKFSGTSMATPHAAGVAAVYASVFASTNAAQVKKHFQNVAIDLDAKGWDKNTGWGVPTFTALFSEEPPEETEPEPTPEPPTEPEPTPDPTPEPPSNPTQKDVFFIDRPLRVVWSRIDDITNVKSTYIKLNVKYTHNTTKGQAGQDLEKATINFFRNRGFVLDTHHGVQDAIYYTAHFYQMLLEKQGIKVEVINAFADFGSWWNSDYLPGPRVRSQDYLNRKNILTYKW